MPKWKGKQVSHKRYYDLLMYKEAREFLKAKRTVYLSRESFDMYVGDELVAKVTNEPIELKSFRAIGTTTGRFKS